MLSIIKKSGYLCKKFHDMLEKIQALLAEIDTLEAHSAEDIEALRIKYLSKKGAYLLSWQTSATCLPNRKRK